MGKVCTNLIWKMEIGWNMENGWNNNMENGWNLLPYPPLWNLLF